LSQNLTAQERITYSSEIALQENYWKKFINQSFSGLYNLNSSYINDFDWLLLLLNGNADQKVVLTAVTLFDYCNKLNNTTCLEVLLRGQIPNEYYKLRDDLMNKLNVSDYTSGDNFISILRTNFSYECSFGSFFYLTRGKLLKEHSYKKFVRKMLMKLTTGFKGIFPTLWHGKLPCYDTIETRPSI